MILPVIATVATLIWLPKIGVYVNTSAVALLLSLGLWRKEIRKLAISIALIPVVNMVSLCLPQNSILNQGVIYYDGLLILGLIYYNLFTQKRPLKKSKLNTKGYAIALPLMLGLGLLIGLFGYGLLRNHYMFTGIPLGQVAAVCIIAAIAEEVIFRGLIQKNGNVIMPSAMSAAMTIILYACLGLNHNTVLTFATALITGTVLSIIYYLKPNLILTMTVNAISKLTYVGLITAFVIH